MSIITLTTDFGVRDYFVGAMKGVILSINPTANLVDISHDIPPQDVRAAAFNLLCCYKDFPTGTVHLAVVDPGVGSDRRALIVECAGQFFVGPDNGLFNWICEREENWTATQVTNEKFFRQPVSSTFHGRDIFAPVAAALSAGVAIDEFGPHVNDIVRLDGLTPAIIDARTSAGCIIHIDRFGNCVTNLAPPKTDRAKVRVNGREITSFRQFFSDAASQEDDELFCFQGSAGFLEIAVQDGSAAAKLSAECGHVVRLITEEDEGQG